MSWSESSSVVLKEPDIGLWNDELCGTGGLEASAKDWLEIDYLTVENTGNLPLVVVLTSETDSIWTDVTLLL